MLSLAWYGALAASRRSRITSDMGFGAALIRLPAPTMPAGAALR
eukprot:CAMPEP_0113679694 /NCGR_PEP_ID=MMETSP0038_2-20120614/10812_1 /TAXON_ID=2898 /ORGANISM="Cryptomonas paramecium" /LENGTH=43 /DNA_ID=CAMNT_0000597805 /DNA_START=661 /DNA_END=788 /DNA_ORIENTATION=+ /assembly_acc=CAM_ASM_000170